MRSRWKGLVRVDGQTLRFMGSDPGDVKAMEQTGMELTPLHTRYHFAGAGIALDFTFFTPAFLSDMDLLSRPVTYLTWTAHSTDGKQHEVSVFVDASPELATSYEHQPITFARASDRDDEDALGGDAGSRGGAEPVGRQPADRLGLLPPGGARTARHRCRRSRFRRRRSSRRTAR